MATLEAAVMFGGSSCLSFCDDHRGRKQATTFQYFRTCRRLCGLSLWNSRLARQRFKLPLLQYHRPQRCVRGLAHVAYWGQSGQISVLVAIYVDVQRFWKSLCVTIPVFSFKFGYVAIPNPFFSELYDIASIQTMNFHQVHWIEVAKETQFFLNSIKISLWVL